MLAAPPQQLGAWQQLPLGNLETEQPPDPDQRGVTVPGGRPLLREQFLLQCYRRLVPLNRALSLHQQQQQEPDQLLPRCQQLLQLPP